MASEAKDLVAELKEWLPKSLQSWLMLSCSRVGRKFNSYCSIMVAAPESMSHLPPEFQWEGVSHPPEPLQVGIPSS